MFNLDPWRHEQVSEGDIETLVFMILVVIEQCRSGLLPGQGQSGESVFRLCANEVD